MRLRPISYLYVDLVKRVAQGLSIEDGEEMARGLRAIRPHERFTTHLFGSAWLCYAVMLTWFWAPMYAEMWLDQGPELQRVSDYELNLQSGVRALNVWKVCQRNVGIVVAFPTPRTKLVETPEPSKSWDWSEVVVAASVLFLFGSCVPHGHGLVQFAAFTNFYLVGGGGSSLDTNAGSSTGARQANTTGGTWVGGTNTFTAASGTPFAATVAGDYASIYVDGGTVTTYVAKVATVTSSTVIVLDGTIKYGTAPADGVNTRSCSINGAWATEQVLAAGGLATTTVPQSTKVNVKGNLTVTASRTVSMAGATTTPLWFSGYNTTPGDLDADTTNTLAKPIWTFNSTFLLTTSGAQQLWSGLSLTGSRSGGMWAATGTQFRLVRCRVENTSSNAAAFALNPGNSTSLYAYAWCKSPSTATTSGVVALNNSGDFIGCVFDTGGVAGLNGLNFNASCLASVFLNNVGAAVLMSTGLVRLWSCTVYGATVDGVKWTGTPSAGSSVIASLFSGLNGSTATTNGINNASGTNTNNVFRSCNDYYNVTNAEVGVGDSFAFFPQTDSSPVVTSATDMTPVSNANARNNGFPGVFENESFSSKSDIGAVEAPDIFPIDVSNVAIFQPRQSVDY